MKKLSEKSLVILLAALLFSVSLHAQWGDVWSEAEAVTDSLSDNKNAVIQLLEFTETDFYLFWEQATDSLSSDILYKKFYSDDQAQVFLSEEGVHFSNPQLMNANYFYDFPDTSFYVFYESDQSGTNRIYYRIYSKNDGFADPQEFTASGQEQSQMLCNNEGLVVWMEQNRVTISKQDRNTLVFDEPVVLDSGNCSFPSITRIDSDWGQGTLLAAWVSTANDSSRILFRRFNQDDSWVATDTLFTDLQCTNLTFCSGFGQPEILTWDYFNGTAWQIVHGSTWDGQLYFSEGEQAEPMQPAFFSGYIPVKSRDIEAGFTGLVYSKNDTVDIRFSDYFQFNPNPESFQNVSQSGRSVQNPGLFQGKYEPPCNTYIIGIWEEMRNGRWQLRWSTTSVCLSGIAESWASGMQLTASPNPFREEVEIAFWLDRPAEVSLAIYTAGGEQLETLVTGKLQAGRHVYKWDGKNRKAGLYFVSLQKHSKRATKKIILTK